MRRAVWAGAALGIALAAGAACSQKPAAPPKDPELPPSDPQPPANPPGAPDAGLANVPLPSPQGWTFYGPQHGGPREAFGVTADQGGNIWVAGGEEGLFLLRRGAQQFERFTIAEGLHPYGYPRPEQGVITRTYLNVSAVSGGPAGTVFVGYLGLPAATGELDCEDNWDGPNPNPDIFKSGDADKVTLTATGIEVVHYDISSGLNEVAAEPRGREKLCHVYRILYDAPSGSVWFGANHGYAWGDPSYRGNPTCFGQSGCSGVREHAHPLLNGYASEGAPSVFALTNYYWGLAVAPNGDLWVGGHFRSQHCPAGMRGIGFWTCESEGGDEAKQIDWWPDAVKSDSRPSQRVDDHVSGIALGHDGSVWVGSFTNGLARLAPDGSVSHYTSGLVDPQHVTAVRTDPRDGSVWVGANYGGLTRIQGGQFVPYDYRAFGLSLVTSPVPDIQMDTSGGGRRVLVAFRGGAVGVYEGP